MQKIKIFSVYHKPYKIFKSDCIEPIQVGCALNNYDLGIVRDDTGDNISNMNGGYCELTAQYWVWKNYMPLHKELQWIGFCHYRRFMDFWGWSNGSKASTYNYRHVTSKAFEEKLLPRCTVSEIESILPQGADIVIPQVYRNKGVFQNQLSNYMFIWGDRGIRDLFESVLELYADYQTDLRYSMYSKVGYHGLTYFMKTDIFNRYAHWMFSVINKTHEKIKTNEWYITDGRYEGLFAELIFNTWLCHEVRVNGLSVVECGGVMLNESEEKSFQKGWFRRIRTRIVNECSYAKAYFNSRRFF